MFLQNNYPNYFFDLALRKLKNTAKQKPRKDDDKNFSFRISIRYFENPSHKFECNSAKLMRRKFDINIAFNYKKEKKLHRSSN